MSCTIRRTGLMALLAFAFIVACLFALPLHALASTVDSQGYGTIDLDQAATITVTPKEGDTAVSGVKVRAWKIAEFTEDGIELVEPFKSSGVSLASDDGSETWPDVAEDDSTKYSTFAESLYEYARTNGVATAAEATTSTAGEATLSGIKAGVYLVGPERTTVSGGGVYEFSPSIVTVPMMQDDTFSYNVSTILKGIKYTEPTSYKVVKHWNLSGSNVKHPSSVKVTIARDGEKYTTVTLSDSNNWTYSWTSEAGHEWTVSEEVPDGYKATNDKNGEDGTFVITNRFKKKGGVEDILKTTGSDDNSGVSGSDVSESSNPSTGDPATMIGILLAVIAVVVVVGFAARRRMKHNE
ncbi:MAG: Cna B-type domain-containing protein [Coriobacteriales bacterium]